MVITQEPAQPLAALHGPLATIVCVPRKQQDVALSLVIPLSMVMFDIFAQPQKYKGFFLKKWPGEFLTSDFEVDAVLLINVANVVPDEDDRKRIVSECTKRLRRGGWFLWMSQYGEPRYKPGVTKRLRAADGGWFYSLDKEHQTYYKEFAIPEIKAYFDATRYRELRKVQLLLPVGRVIHRRKAHSTRPRTPVHVSQISIARAATPSRSALAGRDRLDRENTGCFSRASFPL